MMEEEKLTYDVCSSPFFPNSILTLDWLQVVAYDTAANAGRRIEVLTEQRGRGETRSHLVIEDARPDVDSGNYTCKPSIARPASIKVHVLESKRRRMQLLGRSIDTFVITLVLLKLFWCCCSSTGRHGTLIPIFC